MCLFHARLQCCNISELWLRIPSSRCTMPSTRTPRRPISTFPTIPTRRRPSSTSMHVRSLICRTTYPRASPILLSKRFYQRAELPLINGWRSHLASGCVNSHVQKFCKSGLIEVFRDQIDMLTYDTKPVNIIILVKFEPGATERL